MDVSNFDTYRRRGVDIQNMVVERENDLYIDTVQTRTRNNWKYMSGLTYFVQGSGRTEGMGKLPLLRPTRVRLHGLLRAGRRLERDRPLGGR